MTIEFLPLAEQDLRDIWTYIAEDNPAAADRVLHSLFTTVEWLLEQPRMGVARPELADDLRSIVSGSYLIFYRPLEDRIQVARILHGRRDLHADLF